MDPYLEHPAIWPGFHQFWIVAAAAQLKSQLKPLGYYVNVDERIWLEEPKRHVYPDLTILRRPTTQATRPVAVVDADEPVYVRAYPVEIREGFLEIVDSSSNRIITGVELLSPANKIRTRGRRMFRKKQRELLHAGVHVVEVDLLRSGKHAMSIPAALADGIRPWEYLAIVRRAGAEEIEAYPIRLQNRLPRLKIPLRTGENDTLLDLQAVFAQAYDFGPYPERLNYEHAPTPTLAADDAAWADELLRAAQLRK